MSNKYVFDEEEKKAFICYLRRQLETVKAYPDQFKDGYGAKLERLISAYENNPGAQLYVVKEL